MKNHLFLFSVTIFLLPTLCFAQDNLISHQIGAVKTFQKVDHGVTIKTIENVELDVTVYSPTIVRIRIAPATMPVSSSYAVIQDAANQFTSITDNKDNITLTTDSLKIIVQKN